MNGKQVFKVTWEMKVLAESKEEAEAKMQSFAMSAESLHQGGRYDDFDLGSLKHSDVEEET